MSFLLFFYSASLGSFYKTLALRILRFFYQKERKNFNFFEKFRIIFTKPSSCESCDVRINSLYLIPIFGYFFTKGKCSHCEASIGVQNPAFELAFGGISVFLFWMTGSLPLSLLFPFFLGHLWISLETDANYFSLDFENIPFLLLFGLSCNYFIIDDYPKVEDGLVFIGFALFYGLVHLIYPRGMGLGDVLFAPVFALIAGHPFWLFFLNSSYGLALFLTIALRKKGESLKKKPIPMGVYFALGSFFTMIVKIIFYQTVGEGNYGE